MSLNRLQFTTPQSPILFTDEKIFLTIHKVSLEYENSSYPGQGEQLSCPIGSILLTNIRFIYIPETPTVFLTSLTIPLQNIQDGKFSSSWFGGHIYSTSVKSVPEEGFTNDWGTMKLAFKAGSEIHDFKARFDHLRSELGAMPVTFVEPLPQYQSDFDIAPPPEQSKDDEKPPTYE
ncbi:hypothetical protein BC833DRAFT_610176 [Globomyces pollinis-pini]|nr:hypothetical protein BC833DRAFT_610176 [Globomyces pollinis-pini]